MKNPEDNRVPPNIRVMYLLEVMARIGRPVTPTELNNHVGWPKQTIHRLCQTMLQAGILERHDRRLYPGRRALRMVTGLAHQSVGLIGVHQVLQRVSRRFGETVNFVRPEPQGMMYVDRVETNWAFRVALPIGTHVPFHCTASGKMFMSSLSSARRRSMIEALSLDALTPNTYTDPDSLSREITTIRKEGFSLDKEEFHLGMVAIAVPVSDADGRFYAALAIHGPTQRFSLESARASFAGLCEAAAHITTILFED
jgi:DNA-binding IclR family transcriptional regulator